MGVHIPNVVHDDVQRLNLRGYARTTQRHISDERSDTMGISVYFRAG